MPRTAATMFGLALATAAVGFNISRYPILGKLLAPPTADISPAAAESLPAAEKQIAGPDDAIADLRDDAAIEPLEKKSSAEFADEEPQSDYRVAPVVAEPAARIAEEKNDPTSADKTPQFEPEKPLVAVDLASVCPGANPTVRRLPPVDVDKAVMLTQGIPRGHIPIYPNTGKEIERNSK